jgi:LacI family transcriptional regulator, repressor for deo operon, udp, cdd, tsx, nupC, and nupG
MAERTIRTMDEFAAASGLSRPTVSKYFNDPTSVRPATRARIEQALHTWDYRPNLFAMNLNRRRPRIIGVIVPHTTDPFYAELVRRIELRCIRAGYLALVLSSHGERQLESRAIETLLSLKIAGAIVAPLGFESDLDLIRSLQGRIPIVFMDSTLDDDTAFVGTDNRQSVGLMVDYLSRTGAPPTFFEMPAVNHNARDRHDSYVAAMERLGLQPEIVSVGHDRDWSFEEIGYRETLRILDGPGFPTATILCANDRLAFGVMAAASQKRLKVGREPGCDLRIAGHDDHPLSRYTCPALTTVAQDFDRLGTLATETLLAQVGDLPDEGDGPPLQQRLQGTLMMRETA